MLELAASDLASYESCWKRTLLNDHRTYGQYRVSA